MAKRSEKMLSEEGWAVKVLASYGQRPGEEYFASESYDKCDKEFCRKRMNELLGYGFVRKAKVVPVTLTERPTKRRKR